MNKAINSFYTLTAISLCLLAGYQIEFILGSLPPSLYGMVLFTLLLHFNLINSKKVERTIAWGLKNMGICFVPAGVGMINHFDLIQQHGVMLVALTFITTFVLLTAVGLFFQHIENRASDD